MLIPTARRGSLLGTLGLGLGTGGGGIHGDDEAGGSRCRSGSDSGGGSRVERGGGGRLLQLRLRVE